MIIEESPATRGNVRVLTVVLTTVTVCALPLLLTGAMAVQMRRDLEFGPTGLGVAFATYFVVSAVASPLCGRWAEGRRPAVGLRVSALGAALAMAGLAVVTTWLAAVVLLGVAGFTNALAQPPGSALLMARISPERRGLAFGLKQASIPAASLLSGLAVPVVALTLGWRWAFAAGALFAIIASAIPPRGTAARVAAAGGPSEVLPRSAYIPMTLLGMAAALGTAAATPLGAFVVSSGVERGLAEAVAGIVLAVGSSVGLVVRTGIGWVADRRGNARTLPIVVGMLAIGAAGFVLMGWGSAMPFVAGALLAFGAGWAWQGLFNFAVARHWSTSIATAIGVTQAGLFAGSAAGPVVFGLLADTMGESDAWLVMAVIGLSAAGLVSLVRARYLADV
jgi:MFS family permease